tara:strand:+ start:158 stop:355 length:198 start_codon:yes stop_codon:yes gene_type:complete
VEDQLVEILLFLILLKVVVTHLLLVLLKETMVEQVDLVVELTLAVAAVVPMPLEETGQVIMVVQE